MPDYGLHGSIDSCRRSSLSYTLGFIEETCQRVFLRQYLTDMRKRQTADKRLRRCHELVRRHRTFSALKQLTHLRICPIEQTRNLEQGFVQSPAMHPLLQPFKQLIPVTGAVFSLLLILYDITTYQPITHGRQLIDSPDRSRLRTLMRLQDIVRQIIKRWRKTCIPLPFDLSQHQRSIRFHIVCHNF